jgi:hypothetical protein
LNQSRWIDRQEETAELSRRVVMHPTLMQDVARYRQADLLREAERARLAHDASRAGDELPRRFRFRLRRRRLVGFARPLLGR